MSKNCFHCIGYWPSAIYLGPEKCHFFIKYRFTINNNIPHTIQVAKLSLNEEVEIIGTECLNKMMANLPVASLIEPISVICSNKHDNDELRNVGLNAAIQIPDRLKESLSTTVRFEL